MSDEWLDAKLTEMDMSDDPELRAAAAAIRAARATGNFQKKASVLDKEGNYKMYDVDKHGKTTACPSNSPPGRTQP